MTYKHSFYFRFLFPIPWVLPSARELKRHMLARELEGRKKKWIIPSCRSQASAGDHWLAGRQAVLVSHLTQANLPMSIFSLQVHLLFGSLCIPSTKQPAFVMSPKHEQSLRYTQREETQWSPFHVTNFLPATPSWKCLSCLFLIDFHY